MIRSKAIRNSARGETCTVMSPVCNGDPETTVWAHSNRQLHGHGMGIKANDIYGCYACSACHDLIDGRRYVDGWDKELISGMMERAMVQSLLMLVDKGIVTVKK